MRLRSAGPHGGGYCVWAPVGRLCHAHSSGYEGTRRMGDRRLLAKNLLGQTGDALEGRSVKEAAIAGLAEFDLFC